MKDLIERLEDLGEARLSKEEKAWFKSVTRGKTSPAIDKSEFPPIRGMEGPFRFRNGRTVYYDPKEGKYYDRKKDMYLSQREADKLHEEDLTERVKITKRAAEPIMLDLAQMEKSIENLIRLKDVALKKAEDHWGSLEDEAKRLDKEHKRKGDFDGWEDSDERKQYAYDLNYIESVVRALKDADLTITLRKFREAMEDASKLRKPSMR